MSGHDNHNHDHGHAGGHGHAEGHGHADAWHHHDSSEAAPQHEHAGTIKIFGIIKWFVIMVVGLVITVGILVVYFDHVKTQEWARKVETTGFSKEYNAYRASSQAQVAPAGYELVDPEKGLARAPIDVVMRRVQDQYAAGIKVPAPAPATPAPAAAPSPAATGAKK
jgi:hypothetical protein